MTTYGDLIIGNGTASQNSISSASTEPTYLHRIRTTDGRTLRLVSLPEDVIADEFNLTVIESLPGTRLKTRLYNQEETDRISGLRVGDPSLLNYGIDIRNLPRRKPAFSPLAVQEGKEETGESKEDKDGDNGGQGEVKVPTDPKEREKFVSLFQTEREVKLATDPKLVEAMTKLLDEPSLNKCPDDFQDGRDQPVPFELPDGRRVPVMVTVAHCAAGNILKTVFLFPVAPGFSRKVCSMALEQKLTKEFTFKEVQKSTQLNLALGMNLPTSLLSGLPQSDITPKKGDQVFKDNKPLGDLRFDLGFSQTYVRVHVKAVLDFLFRVRKDPCEDL